MIFHFLSPVLPTNRTIMVGANNVETYGEPIDLMGNDRKIGPLLINSLANTKAVFTTSKGPATLSARPYSGTDKRFVPTLNGPISFRLWGTQTNTGATAFGAGDRMPVVFVPDERTDADGCVRPTDEQRISCYFPLDRN